MKSNPLTTVPDALEQFPIFYVLIREIGLLSDFMTFAFFCVSFFIGCVKVRGILIFKTPVTMYHRRNIVPTILILNHHTIAIYDYLVIELVRKMSKKNRISVFTIKTIVAIQSKTQIKQQPQWFALSFWIRQKFGPQGK